MLAHLHDRKTRTGEPRNGNEAGEKIATES
jgi:hypothetical protein